MGNDGDKFNDQLEDVIQSPSSANGSAHQPPPKGAFVAIEIFSVERVETCPRQYSPELNVPRHKTKFYAYLTAFLH
jgi:hypothetical protein